ncbi:hypothetical protein E2C01_030142 [Portunus trituberculatus]|uniref:Uncharacterized protein n=1 Tax=Portunus trituberculatus TaxID=210409 RepID=A0A5B7ETF2_PORTR|nr:hypothetical protein [Portunus trituberculatus]
MCYSGCLGAPLFILLHHSCKPVTTVGDLNKHLAQRQFHQTKTVLRLTNHVSFLTHVCVFI